MKIQTELIVVADYAMLSDDKKLSVMGIFDKILVRELPASHPRMSFVTVLKGESFKEVDLKIKVLSPSQTELFAADAHIKFGENGKTNMVSNLEGFPFPEAGTYRFVITEGTKEIGEYVLDVILLNAGGEQKILA